MPIATNATAEMQACVDACNACMQACEECYTACLNEPDVQARVHCVQVLRDYADICAMSSQYMARNSQFAPQLCSLCATVLMLVQLNAQNSRIPTVRNVQICAASAQMNAVKWHKKLKKNKSSFTKEGGIVPLILVLSKKVEAEEIVN